MSQLYFSNGSIFELKKSICTVGIQGSFDVSLPSESSVLCDTLLFSIHRGSSTQLTLIPENARIKVNGKSISQECVLSHCDTVQWEKGSFKGHAVLVNVRASQEPSSHPISLNALEILHVITSQIHAGEAFDSILKSSILGLTKLAEAEVGYLISEQKQNGAWQLLTSIEVSPNSHETRTAPQAIKHLISDTIVLEAINKRAPVYFESLVGHPLSQAESVVSAHMFSVACLPLQLNGSVFGVALLYTREPGKSIRKEVLPELSLLSTQMALLLSSHEETIRARLRKERVLQNQNKKSLLIHDPLTSPLVAVEARMQRFAASDLSILIRGETGTGKEVMAREIHRLSPVFEGPFVALNCAAIPSTLLEGVLFGYEKGAFTDAHKSQIGKFQQANGGTLFLDEIGDLPYELQAKLLRVLQEKVVEPLGAKTPIPTNFRLITATHQNLEQLIEEKQFRSDLYYRLCGATLTLPPLKERGAKDIEALAIYFLQQIDPSLTISTQALSKLIAYSWPGNIRELEHTIRRAAVLCENGAIDIPHLEIDGPTPTHPLNDLSDLQILMDLKEAQDKFTSHYVNQVVQKTQGNRAEAARALGISERTLYRILATPHTSTVNSVRSSMAEPDSIGS